MPAADITHQERVVLVLTNGKPAVTEMLGEVATETHFV